MTESTNITTEHRCGEDRMEAPYCLSCGCWGDLHPGAGTVVGGPNCTCDNLHLQGYPSQKEDEERRRQERGHYIRKVDTSGHYCSTPWPNAWPGEIWQCDVCRQQWEFRRTWFERFAALRGNWVKI